MQWREIQKNSFRKLYDLLDFLEIPQKERQRYANRPAFSLNVPRRLAEKMEKGNGTDPLFLQFVPLTDEGHIMEGFVRDAVGDGPARKGEKLLHKYQGRALLITTSACAMHCRYCFRQHFDYSADKGFEKELNLIREDSTLHEIILSGGDPLSLSNKSLAALLKSLSNIEHVKIIRFHTRFIAGIPERIDSDFLALLKQCPKKIVIVTHFNHPRELDQEVIMALTDLQRHGVLLLNQSVLLKGVNDCIGILKELSLALVAAGVVPYYLHQLDRIEGAFHFEVEESRGLELIEELRKELPGYAVPQYVKEVAGAASKIPLLHPRQSLQAEQL